jgi:hypothetical protein
MATPDTTLSVRASPESDAALTKNLLFVASVS